MKRNQKRTIRVTCESGLLPYLTDEVEALGHTPDSTRPTGLEFVCTPDEAMRLNLHLHTAQNVLMLLENFSCDDPEELYAKTKVIPWEEMISPEEYLSVVSSVNTPTIRDWRFASLKVKDAIVDRVMDAKGKRPNAGPQREHFVVHLYWHKKNASLFFNMSGRKLADRGYRKIPHKAPMRETLAAGVVMATGYDGTQPFVNPMCGSGTLAIEAALIATGRAPGLLRTNFGFLHQNFFDTSAWEQIRRDANAQKNKATPPPIVATDIDDNAIWAAKKNAQTAGVEHLIQFGVCDFVDTPLPDAPGIIVINPEYGERLGEVQKLAETYGRIGDFFKQKCPGCTGYIFTGNRELAKKVGLRASRRMEFFNAKIECRLLKYELYKGSREKTDN